MSTSSLLQALRAATASIHTAIEAEADVEARLRDPATRPDMVGRFHTLHEAVETALAAWRPAFAADGYSVEQRSPEIKDALAVLHSSAGPLVALKPPQTYGEAVGWMYVMEGSMLGGRVMRKGMIRDDIALEGLSFLDPWGDETGSRWQAFMLTMESACASGRAPQEDILKGARDAFRTAFRLLVPPAR